jgi:hypothetical protein
LGDRQIGRLPRAIPLFPVTDAQKELSPEQSTSAAQRVLSTPSGNTRVCRWSILTSLKLERFAFDLCFLPSWSRYSTLSSSPAARLYESPHVTSFIVWKQTGQNPFSPSTLKHKKACSSFARLGISHPSFLAFRQQVARKQDVKEARPLSIRCWPAWTD